VTTVLRVLIVDDNLHFLSAARDLLGRQGLIVVGVASSSIEALRLATEMKPDIVLVDVDLGGESGLDLARMLVDGNVHGRQQHVILMSAYPEEEFAELIDESPAAGFIAKSDLSGSAIVEVVGRLLDDDS
jgi:DNA-binding NarL/FixJ family response regulator